MLYLQTTQKARDELGIGRQRLDTAGETASPLGNWMLNVVPVGGRWALLFMSTRSFLSFPMMLGQHQPTLQDIPSFMTHGLSLLMREIRASNDHRDRLLQSFDEIFVCKARDRSLLAVHSAIAADYFHRIDRMGGMDRANMDEVISHVNSTPRALLGYKTSFEASAALLRQAGPGYPVK